VIAGITVVGAIVMIASRSAEILFVAIDIALTDSLLMLFMFDGGWRNRDSNQSFDQYSKLPFPAPWIVSFPPNHVVIHFPFLILKEILKNQWTPRCSLLDELAALCRPPQSHWCKPESFS
jgi:hypothetical protein